MNALKKTFVLGILAFWALMTNHCRLELISGLEFLACSPQSEPTPHQPSDCGDENNTCATVESGLYKAEDSQIVAAKAPVMAVAFACAILFDITALESPTRPIAPESSPPELVRAWQFSFRAALPPRAPSLLS